MPWEPASVDWVVGQLHRELPSLHPTHRALLEPLLVPPYSVSVESHPSESVVVVAERGSQVLYWSDIEEAWELDTLTSRGGIRERGSSQSELSQITHLLFGSPGGSC